MSTIPPVTNPDDNSTIRQMREQIDNLNNSIREKDTALADRDSTIQQNTEKLAELDRLKAEKAELETKLSELEPIRDEHGRLVTKFEQLYTQELESIPEEHRERIQKLTASGSWADRVDAIRDAKALIGQAPLRGGPSVQPGSTPNDAGNQNTFDPNKPPAWGDCFKPAGASSQ